ncbi:coiled-coil-helix-coiled-coil-helix domain containing 3 [Arctopsyche grandis]|uniref:coiled-coil-helix-coiled-coil-helix domain containing 3 n=1 Tax=Arctopsyche grandis TaxID=121162 RepID=UPI00406D8C1B
MGNSSSSQPRSVSFENRQPIQLTEAALRKAAAQSQSPSTRPETETETETHSTRPTSSPPQGYPQVPPNFYKPQYDYSGEEEYWTKRIETLKRTHTSLNNKMEQEYDKAVAETGQMFKRAQASNVGGKLPPCQEAKNLVLKCYNENSTQPLLCAHFVNEFNNCVNNKRLETTATGA